MLAMPVIGLDSPLQVGCRYAYVKVKLWRVQHLLFWHRDRHPLFAHVATNLLNRDQKVLLGYPKNAPGAHDQVAWPASSSIDVEVGHSSYLLVCDIVDVEIADILPTLFEGHIQLAQLNQGGARLATFHRDASFPNHLFR